MDPSQIVSTRPVRPASRLAELSGLPSDTELVSLLQSVLSEQEAIQQLGLCQARDARLILAGTPNATVVEVGAALGSDTILYAALAGKVIAYEAGPATANKLVKTVDEFRRQAASRNIATGEVRVESKAVSDKTGRTDLFMVWGDSDQASASQIEGLVAHSTDHAQGQVLVESLQDAIVPQPWFLPSNTTAGGAAPSSTSGGSKGSTHRSVQVDVVRLDDELDERIDYLEIDVQGADFAVLRGARRLIEHHGVGVIRVEYTPLFLREAGEDPIEMLHWLYDRGYVCFDTPDDCEGKRTAFKWEHARLFAEQPGGEWGGAGRAGTGAKRVGNGMVRGPVLFKDLERALGDGQLGVEYHGHTLPFWTDLLCFQN